MTLKELKDKFREQTRNSPPYYEDEDGGWFGDYDVWQIELGYYHRALESATKLALMDDDSVDHLLPEGYGGNAE